MESQRREPCPRPRQALGAIPHTGGAETRWCRGCLMSRVKELLQAWTNSSDAVASTGSGTGKALQPGALSCRSKVGRAACSTPPGLCPAFRDTPRASRNCTTMCTFSPPKYLHTPRLWPSPECRPDDAQAPPGAVSLLQSTQD